MATMKSNEVSPLVFATLQGLGGGVAGLDGCLLRDCAVKSIEGDYLKRSREVEAKLMQFPKVMAGPLGAEFTALKQYLTTSLNKLRTGDYATPGTGWFRTAESPAEIEKKAYANYLRMAQIDAAILSEAQKLGDTGVQLDPAVQNALTQAGNDLTPGQKELPSDAPPINWWLWGGIGGGVLVLGSALWWYASKKTKKATAVAGIGRMGRKSRSRRHSR